MRYMMLQFKGVGEGDGMSVAETEALGKKMADELDVNPELLVFDGSHLKMHVMLLRFRIVGEGEEMSAAELKSMGERMAVQLDVSCDFLVFDDTSVVEVDEL